MQTTLPASGGMDKSRSLAQLSGMQYRPPRIAARALILHDDRLLLVNAYAGAKSDLWCAPGGGVEPGSSLPENLIREVHEETGLTVGVGPPVLVNEFHDPTRGFHQIEVFFRCTLLAGATDPAWRDPEGIVNRSGWFSRQGLSQIRVKPDSIAAAAWGGTMLYDPLEWIVP